MNRNEVIAGSALAVLAALGLGQLYLDRGAQREPPKPKEIAAVSQAQEDQHPTEAETKPISIDEVVSGFMTSLEQGTPEQKLVALTGLLDEVEGPTYAKSQPSPETSEPMSKAAIAAVTVSTEAETPEIGQLRDRLVHFMASRAHDAVSKKYVLDQLDNGTPEIRAEIARGLAKPGAMHGKEVFEAVVARKDQLPGESLPAALRRAGGKKAIEPIVDVMKNSDQWKTIGACVTSLQDYDDPVLLGAAFERLEQTGLLDKNEKLPWISPKLYGKFMEKADGTPLQRGLRAAATRPSLLKVAVEAAKRGLDSSDPETRRVAAMAVRKAVVGKVLEAKDGEAILAGRLDHETEPVLKAELTGGLQQVRDLIRGPVGQQ